LKKSTFAGVIVLPLLRHVVLVEDRLDRADRLARPAIHALVRVDVEHPVAFVDAVDRTFVDARAVLEVHAGLSYHVGHGHSFMQRGQLAHQGSEA